jgi:hypothetical protein
MLLQTLKSHRFYPESIDSIDPDDPWDRNYPFPAPWIEMWHQEIRPVVWSRYSLKRPSL